MTLLSSDDYATIQEAQTSTMHDLCNIYRVTLVSGTYGSTESRSLYVSGISCGIDFTNGKIIQRGETLFVDYDAILRIVDNVSVLMTDEIELIEKGEFLISGTFKPYSAPTVNSSVQKVPLKRQAP